MTFALCLAVLLALVVAPAVAKEKKAKQGQLNGTVHMINKDTSTITVMKNNAQRQVVYNNDTKWMYGTQADAKPSSLDQLKENWYVNCKGTFDGVKLVASACRFRESK
jgi:membrane protein implicated in regulation of membrane protease activity